MLSAHQRLSNMIHAPSDADGVSPAETLSQLSLLTEDKQHLMWSRVPFPPGSVIPPRYGKVECSCLFKQDSVHILSHISYMNLTLSTIVLYFVRRSGAASVVVKGKLYMFGVSLWKHIIVLPLSNYILLMV